MSWPRRELDRRPKTFTGPASTTADNSLEGRVVLVLEPDGGTRENLVKVLTESGCVVTGFETLPELMAALDTRDADCVVADTSPPEALGLRLLNLLSSRSRPPVILTAHGTELTDAVHAMRAGASDFLEKPLSRPILLSRLRHLMDLRHPRSGNR